MRADILIGMAYCDGRKFVKFTIKVNNNGKKILFYGRNVDKWVFGVIPIEFYGETVICDFIDIGKVDIHPAQESMQ